jgi:hypothetical protein
MAFAVDFCGGLLQWAYGSRQNSVAEGCCIPALLASA